MQFNKELLNLENNNSFYKATAEIREYKKAHPHHHVVSLGIGDVSFPINRHVADKMIDAINKEASSEFVGYGNYYGLPELRQAIRDAEYPDFEVEEIYVSQGTKSDCGDILEILDKDVLIGIPSPTYPIYENSCISFNRRYEIIDSDEDFVPLVPNKHFDVIYLCSPNNPVGISYKKEQLQKWVDYANKENCLIIFDNVYYRFISEGVKSIYEIEGAKTCAIEMRSFSKHASFTGIRCSYYVIPNALHTDVNKYWRLRTINRFNGASYIAQVGALASFDLESKKEIDKHIEYYKNNALFLLKSFQEMGFEVKGGVNAPYLWIKCQKNMTSWETFRYFLNKLEVVVVPGAIFGPRGDNYFRVSALGQKEDIIEAIERIKHHGF